MTGPVATTPYPGLAGPSLPQLPSGAPPPPKLRPVWWRVGLLAAVTVFASVGAWRAFTASGPAPERMDTRAAVALRSGPFPGDLSAMLGATPTPTPSPTPTTEPVGTATGRSRHSRSGGSDTGTFTRTQGSPGDREAALRRLPYDPTKRRLPGTDRLRPRPTPPGR